jgi:hypothetical protein
MTAAFFTFLLWASASAPGWNWGNTALELTLDAAIAVDVAQTINCMHSTTFRCTEENPFVGKRPDDFRLVMWGFWAAVGHGVIAYFLPRPWREVWQMVILNIEVFTVVHNQFTFGLGGTW